MMTMTMIWGYIIAYIEPQGLVHRLRFKILKLTVMTMVIQDKEVNVKMIIYRVIL